MAEQHEVYFIIPRHPGALLIGKLGIIFETEGFVESHGRLHVGNWQAHKNLLAHPRTLGNTVFVPIDAGKADRIVRQ